VVGAANKQERGKRFIPRNGGAHVLTDSVKRECVTEIIVETVALRTVADVAVEQDTVALAVNKVSLS